RDALAVFAVALHRDRADRRGELVARDLGRIALLDARALADQPPVLRVRLHRVVRHAGPVVPQALVLWLEPRPDRVGLLDEPALADPGLADEEERGADPVAGALERRADALELALAPDERGLERSHRAHAPGRGETPADAERRDGLALALHVDPPEVLDVEQVGDEPVRVLGDLHRAG